MTLFVSVLPTRATLRLWDLLLLDAANQGGSSAVPLMACLGLPFKRRS